MCGAKQWKLDLMRAGSQLGFDLAGGVMGIAQRAREALLELVARGALVVCNHSAGKDSQALYLWLREVVPPDQLVVVHAVLTGGVDWDGTEDHIRATVLAHPIHTVQADKTLLEMVDRRYDTLQAEGRIDVSPWPSPQYRQCTSDLKAGPIAKWIRRYLKANPRFGGLVVNALGIRAEESTKRAKRNPCVLNTHASKAGREWYDISPLFDWREDQVFEAIARAGQQPFWVYGAGLSRASCIFCIMGSRADLTRAATLRPELYALYCAMEARMGFTLSMDRRSLPELTGIAPMPLPETLPAALAA